MSKEENARILASLALLGTDGNRVEDFLADEQRGIQLAGALHAFNPGLTGFRNEDVYAAIGGLARLTEGLLDHLLHKHRGQERIKNLKSSGTLLLLLRAAPVVDRKSLNRILGTFYEEWAYASHWRRDLFRIPAGGLTVTALIFFGMQKLRDLLDEQTGLI